MSRLSNGNSPLRDYVGPSIDTGFRLGAFSSSRKCILSIDLAYLLSHVSGNLTSVDPPLKHFTYFYEGKHVLKGVNNGSPYPIFWIDASEENDTMTVLEDTLEKRSTVPHSDVKRFCEHFLEKNKDTHIMVPYITDDKSDIMFSKIPERHQIQLSKLFSYYTKEKERFSHEKNAALDDRNDNSVEMDLNSFLDEIKRTFEKLPKNPPEKPETT